MPRTARLVAWVLLTALFAAPLPASAKQIWEYPWIEVRSEHFTVCSAISEERHARS